MNRIVGLLAGLALTSLSMPGQADPRGGCIEAFDSVATLGQRGWVFKNNSNPPGSTGWFQGVPARFPAQAGAPASYLSADKDSAGSSFPVLSNWAITPVLQFHPGLLLAFHTRSAGGTGSAADRLQVLYCQRGPGVSCTNPGASSGSANNYQSLLWINVNGDAGGYPTSWTAYNIGAAQGLPTSGSGRVAFRYYTLWQNPNDWGSTIGIDSLSQVSGGICSWHDTVFRDGMQGAAP